MKSVAKITVLLMAMTASEASRLGSPSEVSDDSSFVGWTWCVVVVVVIVVVVVVAVIVVVIVVVAIVLFKPSSTPNAGLPTTSSRCRH